MKSTDALLALVAFALVIVLAWLAVGWSILGEEIRRAFIRWELNWNHPEEQPWKGFPESRWGPRYPWLCFLADHLTGGRCHD